MKTKIRRTIARGVVCAMLVLLIFSLTALPGAAQTRQSTPDFAAIDRYVEQEMRATRLPGLALGIVQGDQIVYLKGFGVVDSSGRAVTPQTPFKLASLGKSFTALAVMQLVEAGKVDLDAPVQHYLPFFRLADAQASARITVRHLLNQTSGISSAASEAISARQYTGADAIERNVRDLATTALNRPVGATYEYANMNYVVLGLIVQTVSGQPYAQYIRQQIFAPLEMHNAYLDPAEDHERGAATGHSYWFGFPRPAPMLSLPGELPAGADGFSASAEDMAHYLIAQLGGGRYGERQVLSPEGIATLHQPAVPAGAPGEFYGMGWAQGTLNGVPVVQHSGTIPTAYARILLAPTSRWGVIVLMNSFPTLQIQTGDLRITAIASDIFALLHGHQPPAQPVGYGIWLVYAAFLLPVAIQIAGMGRSVLLLQRWRTRPRLGPTGRGVLLRRIGLPLTLNLLWGLTILVGIPTVTERSLQYLGYYYPDLIATLTVSAVVALSWGVLRAILALVVLRTQATPQAAAQPATT